MTRDANGRDHQQAGVPVGGQYATMQRDEADDLTVGEIPLSEREPSDIDGELAELTYEGYRLSDRRAMYADTLHRAAGDKKHYRWSKYGDWTMTDEDAVKTAREMLAKLPAEDYNSRTYRDQLKKYDELTTALDEVRAKAVPLDEEFKRRPWNREFIVQNADGHSHTSMHCPSCNKGRSATRFAWMTEFSGKDKYELLEAAGWRICDVCHPLDPKDEKDPRNRPEWKDPLKRPTNMFTKDDLEKEAARREREAAKMAREQKKLAGSPTSDGSPLRIDKGWSTEDFASERSALIWATDHLAEVAQKAERPDNFAPHMDEKFTRAGASLETLLDAVAIKRVAANHEVLGADPKDVFGAVAYHRGVDEAEIAEELKAELAQTRQALRAELEAKGAAKWAKIKKEWDKSPYARY